MSKCHLLMSGEGGYCSVYCSEMSAFVDGSSVSSLEDVDCAECLEAFLTYTKKVKSRLEEIYGRSKTNS